MARRKELGRAYSDKAFHSKIICGDCGGFYGRKVWHSTDEYRSVIFQCNQKFKNMKRCATPTLTEDEIKQRFLTAYNDLMGNRSTVLADCELIRQTLCDTTALDAEMQQEQDEMAVVSELMPFSQNLTGGNTARIAPPGFTGGRNQKVNGKGGLVWTVRG